MIMGIARQRGNAPKHCLEHCNERMKIGYLLVLSINAIIVGYSVVNMATKKG